jgi:hypothetical protein
VSSRPFLLTSVEIVFPLSEDKKSADNGRRRDSDSDDSDARPKKKASAKASAKGKPNGKSNGKSKR